MTSGQTNGIDLWREKNMELTIYGHTGVHPHNLPAQQRRILHLKNYVAPHQTDLVLISSQMDLLLERVMAHSVYVRVFCL